MPTHAIWSLALGLILSVTVASSATTYYRNISTVVLLFRDFARLKTNLLNSNNYSVAHYERELPDHCEHFRMIANHMLDSTNEIEFRFKERFFMKLLEREASQCSEGAKYKGYLLPPINYINGIQVPVTGPIQSNKII